MNKLIVSLLIPLLYGCTPCKAMEPEQVVALTLLGEARCQKANDYEGMKAIAQVILNRSKQRGLPVSAVCLQRKQFSCWNDKEAMVRRREALMSECERATEVAQCLAAFICNGLSVHETKANHYYNPELCSPSWAKNPKSSKMIGDHLFLEL